MDTVRLSKKLALVLRHRPWVYELELDDEGWTDVEQLLAELGNEHTFRGVTRADIEQVIATSSKVRYQLDGDRIRALYGHSVPGKLTKRPAPPPEILYHGTQSRTLPLIRASGLKPMRRQYVHLSVDTDMAQMVGARRGDGVVILTVRADDAAAAGVVFYEGNAQVWLADGIAPEWIVFPEGV